MCGPIALALPIGNNSVSRFGGILAYNSGRAITYGVIGTVFGFIGLGFSIIGWQQVLSILCGIFIVLITLFSLLGTTIKFSGITYRFISYIKTIFGNLLQRKSPTSIFLLGLVNGLLPCGLVYIALGGATATGNPISAALFMVFFGLGTIPAMAFIVLIKNSINVSWRTKIRKIVPVLSVTIGILLIVRGLNLGIPYLSPESENKTCKLHCCH
ncbi:MAG: sulfite exporter TauE/SafE family protein [Cytophagaceae bacterium]|nr:sulfite exporter TauE/SafE family protein [Cytophagaceae bacterium]